MMTISSVPSRSPWERADNKPSRESSNEPLRRNHTPDNRRRRNQRGEWKPQKRGIYNR